MDYYFLVSFDTNVNLAVQKSVKIRDKAPLKSNDSIPLHRPKALMLRVSSDFESEFRSQSTRINVKS